MEIGHNASISVQDRGHRVEDVVTRLSQPEEADITSSTSIEDLSVADLEALAADLDVQMRRAAEDLDFERAAMLRDRLWAISQALGTDS